MDRFKITCWNIKHSDRLVDQRNSDNATTKRKALARLEAITEEIAGLGADILFVSEGPRSEARAKAFFDIVAPDHELVTRGSDRAADYGIKGGSQWLWFLVRKGAGIDARLQHLDRWEDTVTRASRGFHENRKWPVSFPKYDADRDRLEFSISETASHYRHPQVLQVDIGGAFFEVIGAHLRSKHTSARATGDVTGDRFFEMNPELVSELITDRVRLVTECADIRYYLDSRFEENEDAAVIVVGDLNDGPGKERIERRFMYQDLVTALQGDVFFAQRFLNHALFDAPHGERWSVDFQDKLDPDRPPFILLDHILFSQSMTRSHAGARFAFLAQGGSGKVEHELHHRVASTRFKYAETSDHRPVSMEFARPAPS